MPRIWYSQGDDGLCGFYALLNAFRFLERNASGLVLPQDFFDEAVESLAGLEGGGVNLRILKRNTDSGGIDKSQIADVCRDLAKRHELSIQLQLVRRRFRDFASLYRYIYSKNTMFSLVVGHADKSHWVTVGMNSVDKCKLIDNSPPVLRSVTGSINGILGGSDCIALLASA